MDSSDKFFIDDMNCVHCLDTSLSRECKIKAVHERKREIKRMIYLSFAEHIKERPDIIHTWFSHRIDGRGYDMICFSEKSAEYLNDEFKISRLKPSSSVWFFREFVRVLKMSSGDSKFSIRKFICSCAGQPAAFKQ